MAQFWLAPPKLRCNRDASLQYLLKHQSFNFQDNSTLSKLRSIIDKTILKLLKELHVFENVYYKFLLAQLLQFLLIKVLRLQSLTFDVRRCGHTIGI